MVHRLRNWILLRDIMCSNREMAANIILQALRSVVSHKEAKGIITDTNIDENAIRNMITNCGCVISQDGFEICLLTWREELTPLFRNCPGECSHFEEFLQVLDTILHETKELMAVRHEF